MPQARSNIENSSIEGSSSIKDGSDTEAIQAEGESGDRRVESLRARGGKAVGEKTGRRRKD